MSDLYVMFIKYKIYPENTFEEFSGDLDSVV
jgi:hypothetical protein